MKPERGAPEQLGDLEKLRRQIVEMKQFARDAREHAKRIAEENRALIEAARRRRAAENAARWKH